MTTSGGAQVELPLMGKAQTMLNVFRGLPPGTLAPGEHRRDGAQRHRGRRVRRPTSPARSGASASTSSTSRRTPTEDVERTTVLYGYYAGGLAKRVAAHITGGAALVQDDTLGLEEVVVVTGSDFTTIHDQPAPEGSPDDRAHHDDHHGARAPPAPGETTTTTAPPTTTTTVIGYSTGEPPDGVDCG